MITRCTNPKRPNFYLYGGRGIKVCESWLNSFENFLADMGLRPEAYQLDRINTDGHYEPNNCRWATPKENSNNRRQQEDICTGKQFGSWLVLSPTNNRDGNGGLKYLCRCSCGFEALVKKKALLSGESTKCKECANSRYLNANQDVVGKKYNKWTVVSILKERTSRGKIQFICKCECGNISYKIKYQLENNRSLACRSCVAYERERRFCVECNCFGHKIIDLETSECDLLGFCTRCDKFNLKSYLKQTY
jgi:hypothetical protein